MTVPYTFGNATTSIPLSNLDADFATPITLGNTNVYLGNTTTNINNLSLGNVSITSVGSTFPNSYLSNSSATLGNAVVTLGGTTTSVGNLTLTNVTISSVASTLPNSYLANSSVTINGTSVALGGSATITANAAATLTISTGLSGTSYNGGTAVTIAIDSTVATLTGVQTLTNKTINGSNNTLSNIPNSALTNNTVTVNGTSIALGASGTVTAAAGTLTGTTLNSTVVTSSLTSVGTITTGVWNGTAIGNTYLANSTISGVSLGSNLANLTAGTNISFSSGTTYNGSSAITINATASPQVYPGAGIANSTGTAWGTSYSTTGSGTVVALATSPTFVTPILGTPTSGTLTNTTGFPAANLAGTALPSAIVTSSLTAVGTIATGVWNGTTIAIANGGTGQTTASAGFNALSPITTTGDLIIGNGTNSATRLAIGANTYVLTSNGTTASWVAPSGGGGSQATATALGTVYALQTTGGGTPYLTAFGYNAGVNTTGASNTAIGTQALQANTTASNNTAVGYQAGYSVTTTSGIVAIGYQALYSVQTDGTSGGGKNTAVGYKALYTNAGTNGYFNTAVGYNALVNTIGGNNIGIGLNAGSTNSTGNQGIYIGSGADASASGISSEIVIGTNVSGKGTGSFYAYGTAGGSSFNAKNSAAWDISSDRRLKKNIIDNSIGLDKIIQIQVRNFEYCTENEIVELPKNSAINIQGIQLGVIAQELKEILPDCVKEESTGVLTVDTTDVMWHMINAIKELNAEIQALKSKVGI